MRFIPVTEVEVGMVNSMGQAITKVKHTAKQVHITTISMVDGKPMVERMAKGSQMVVQS